MFSWLIRESSLLTPDFVSFRRQELTFIVLNEVLLGALLLSHILFASYLGDSPALSAVLAGGFLVNAVEFRWIRSRRSLSREGMIALTWWMIVLNLAIALALASLSHQQDILYQDIQCFALMITPIFQAAFRLSLGAVLFTLSACVSLIFYWVWNYFRLRPPAIPGEYIEAATVSLIYAIAGLTMWTLVSHLRSKQADLARSVIDLEQARHKLLIEEKLAAVGRFSSAIAHEIRNPVAMISSALTTAFNRGLTSSEGQVMFEIAAREASRLERLTADFLAYAHPRSPSKQRADVADSIAYVADLCRPRATAMTVDIRAESRKGLWADIDGGQLQQALLNLATNAIEASSPKSTVVLRGGLDDRSVRIEIENDRGPIPAEAVQYIFEPFFTTKPAGTGLGLAIARSIVLGQGGDLLLSRNEPALVQFSIVLPTVSGRQSERS